MRANLYWHRLQSGPRGYRGMVTIRQPGKRARVWKSKWLADDNLQRADYLTHLELQRRLAAESLL